MKFKVGDKVKIIKFPNPDMVGEVCEIVVTQVCPSYPYDVRAINIKHWSCLMKVDEIEKISTKGKQLLFSFMK